MLHFDSFMKGKTEYNDIQILRVTTLSHSEIATIGTSSKVQGILLYCLQWKMNTSVTKISFSFKLGQNMS